MKTLFLSAILLIVIPFSSSAKQDFIKDIIKTSAGNLEITFIGHGTLMFAFDGKIIHVDPFGRLADYSKLPKADIILVTHDHRDHLDPKALEMLRTGKTIIVRPKTGARSVKGGTSMRRSLLLTTLLTAFVTAPAKAAFVQWKLEDGGNGHWYKLVTKQDPLTWQDARDSAQAAGGYLLTWSHWMSEASSR